MLIQARQMVAKIRLRLQDMQKTAFSDYELLSALNDARSMLWMALAENFSGIPRKTLAITLVDGKAPLPDDYYTLVSMPCGACIDGFEIVVPKADTAELVYNAMPVDVHEMADSVSVPAALMIDLSAIAALIAQGDLENAKNTAMESANRISQKREHAGVPDRRPFP